MKVIINAQFGGFSLSEACIVEYLKRKGVRVWPEPDPRFGKFIMNYWLVPPGNARMQEMAPGEWCKLSLDDRRQWNEAYSKQVFNNREVKRDDAILISVIEDLGAAACSGTHATLKIVEIPNDVEWQIEEYDGYEHVAEKHRTWD